MRLLVITSNSLRHFALISRLAVDHQVTALIQCPGPPATPIGPAQAAYYGRMASAERAMFPDQGFQQTVRVLTRPLGRQQAAVPPIYGFNRAVVFGGGLITGELLTQCIDLRAINLHAGISPQYRGTACNFWAASDGHPDLVGCTLHELTAAVDDGAVYAHCLARADDPDPWRRSMQTVADAIERMAGLLERPAPAVGWAQAPRLRYSRAADFTEAVAAEFLARYPEPIWVHGRPHDARMAEDHRL